MLEFFQRTRKPLCSSWFINVPGNFAVRSHIIKTKRGLRAWLTVRNGSHGKYVYSYLPVEVPENIGLRKAYRKVCQQAEHLAWLRYRFC